MSLNAGQQVAIKEMKRAKGHHLLLGNAGTGKTYLMDRFTSDLASSGVKVIVTAPTHKATAVLSEKISHPDVSCCTIHSLLSLTPREGDNGTFLHRRPTAKPIEQKVVVIDEASMLSRELMTWIDKVLYRQSVIFAGDNAQLPPVGEDDSLAFQTQSVSRLTDPVRQESENPILQAALMCRDYQSLGKDDFAYLEQNTGVSRGIYKVHHQSKGAWIEKAFKSEQFKRDPNAFRYLAWTNNVVDDVNKRIQYMLYGDIETPLAPGEMALNRKRFSWNGVEANNSEEFIIDKIEAGECIASWREFGGDKDFTIPIWKVRTTSGKDMRMVRDWPSYQKALTWIQKNFKRLSEPSSGWGVYQHLSDFRDSFAHLTSNFAMTVHNSQGSTFGSVFLDRTDIMRRRRGNLLETHRLFYVAMTRPKEMVFCV